jgi:hypothetical protein
MILLAFFVSCGLFVVACGGEAASIKPEDEQVDREDLVNPAEDGEEVLVNLPVGNPSHACVPIDSPNHQGGG